jgi:hypothetical protein
MSLTTCGVFGGETSGDKKPKREGVGGVLANLEPRFETTESIGDFGTGSELSAVLPSEGTDSTEGASSLAGFKLDGEAAHVVSFDSSSPPFGGER